MNGCGGAPTITAVAGAIAIDRNLFEKHALETAVTYVRGGKNIVAALLSGQSDMAVILPSSFVLANLQGADFVFIGNSHSLLKYVLMAHPSIKAPVDLKGKRLAISTVGDLSHAMTLLALQRLGIGEEGRGRKKARRATQCEVGRRITACCGRSAPATFAAASRRRQIH